MQKAEKTDIHYRVLEGDGSFNYRFVFDFDYNSWEQMIVAYRKTRFFRKKLEENVDPILVVQIWDNNKFKKDKYIGQVQLNLLGFDEGQMDEDDMPNVYYEKEKTRCCCIRVCKTFCCCWCCCKKCNKKGKDMKKLKLPRAPVYIPGKVSSTSLFDQKAVRGWWPCVTDDLPDEQKTKLKKKDDDFDETIHYVTGLIEMDISLLPTAEAKKDPVGKKRKKPNHSPYLPKPDRPKMDNFWCTSRCKAGSAFFWKKCGWQCICATLCILFTALIIFIIIWRFPDIMVAIFKK
ncbi:hypothetical protein L596_006939 [Steinernema carpocapsae]|uniref:Ferlin C-terminal domain-containing protein n=1 Tax=Steinernema carpocapsae TaxID=34508 RepID=A0A4U5P7M6_STECR|nr:hypothetical protein L596_006939 [Steinernema carpocapsae]